MRNAFKILCFFLISISLCGAIYKQIIDPDIWWHVTVGKWIISNQTVPLVEHWNVDGAGKPWLSYSWLTQILFAWTDLNYGNSGLFILKIITMICGFFILFLCSYAISRSFTFSALMGSITAFSLENHCSIRPQMYSWWALAIILVCGLVIKENKFKFNKKTFFSYLCLTCCFCFWANTNITTVIGLGILFMFVFEPIKPDIKGISILLIVCFIATLITPYYGREWLTFLNKSSHPLEHLYIAEFQPSTLKHKGFFALTILFSLYIWLLHYARNSVNMLLFIFTVMLYLGAYTFSKFVPQCAVFLLFQSSLLWRDLNLNMSKTTKPFGEDTAGLIGYFVSKLQRLSKIRFATHILFVLLLVSNYETIKSIRNHAKEPLTANIPKEAVDFILNNKLKGPIVSGFSRGGYLMYRLSDDKGNPTQLVAIDGRTNVNSKETTKAFLNSLGGGSDWDEFFKYTKAKTVLWHSSSPTAQIMEISPKWKLLYKDEESEAGNGFVVFSKTNPS